MYSRWIVRFLTLGALISFALLNAPSISRNTAGLEKRDGHTPFYWDIAQGKGWLEISRWCEEFIYTNTLPAGIGSNGIGLDRGLLSRTRAARWERVGPRVMLVESDYGYRASSEDDEHNWAVRDSFAGSVLWGFDVAVESAVEMVLELLLDPRRAGRLVE